MKLSCNKASRLMSEGQDRGLAFGERVALRMHLLICTACGRVEKQFAFMRRAAGEYPGPEAGDAPQRKIRD